jgi:Xaa-Pro aminopeptidase
MTDRQALAPGDGLPPLTVMDVPSRLDLVRDALAEAEVDGLIVTKRVNVRWLTGFTGSRGLVVVTDDELLVVTDGRYGEQVRHQLDQAGVQARVEITAIDVGSAVATVAAGRSRIGLEAQHVTWHRRDQIDRWLPDTTLVPTLGLIEELRRTKDDGELSRLVRAAALADTALAEVAPTLADRPTELQVARALDRHMEDHGADEPSYETIVASGPNAALPHATPTDRIIESGDLVVIDVGARIDGYGSDMTRTFVAGCEPTITQRAWHDAVVEAQAAGIAAVADGVDERAVDSACRSVLASHGLVDAFVHGTGHGIGLEIHEQPILSPRSDGILLAGLVVTVEPGVYIPGRGGVRVEDSVVVGVDGCRPITHSLKGLVP